MTNLRAAPAWLVLGAWAVFTGGEGAMAQAPSEGRSMVRPARAPSPHAKQLVARQTQRMPEKQQGPELLPPPDTSETTPYRLAAIHEITLDIRPAPGRLPPDEAAGLLQHRPSLNLAAPAARGWPTQVMHYYGVPLHYMPRIMDVRGTACSSGEQVPGKPAADGGE